MTDAAIDAAMDQRAAVSDRFATRVRPHFRLSDLTRTFCLLRKRDVSVLPAGSTASWQTMLKAMGELCSKELFDTRVLSRDMLKLSDDLDGLFEAMCDALGQRANAQRRLAGGYPNQSRQFAINRAVEDSVVIPLLPLIGCLNVDGTTRISADSKFCVRLEGLRDLGEVVDGPVIVNYARKAVEVISRTFLERTPAEVESAYFTLPPTPEWVLDEFQTVYADDVDGLESQPASEVFERLMEMLKTSKGPLVGESLTQLKDAIIVLPEILEMTTNDELCSLYHHAAAGPARDRRLVEWMHQHEAQKVQPKHCRLRTSPEVLAAQGTRKLCNELAVHSATKVGDLDIVRLLLEACHLHDIDTVTYHTRDSLAHLAVKHGHKTLFQLLKAFDADVTRKNAEGKFVYDLTTDADWRRSIVELALVQRRHQVSMNREGATTTSQFRQQNQAAADKLRRELSAQQEAEHRQLRAVSSKKPNFQAAARPATSSENQESVAGPRNGEPSTEAAVNSATKKKKKKTKKKKQKSAVPADEKDTTETNLLERLQLHENDDEFDSDSDFEPSSYEKVNLDERLARWFHVLKESSTASAEQRRCSAIDVIYSLRNLRDKLQTYATANAALMRSEMMEKDAVDAHGALLQLNKYYRQLPHPIDAQTSLDRWTLELQDLAGRDFAQFLSFAANISHVLVACNRATQAQEVLAVVERRLLKAIEQSTARSFRRYIELFVEARQHAKLEPPTGSTPEAQQLFERILTTGQDEVEVR